MGTERPTLADLLLGRVAVEPDPAEDRGEVAGHGFKAPNGNVEPTAPDLGVSRKDTREAKSKKLPRLDWRALLSKGKRKMKTARRQ